MRLSTKPKRLYINSPWECALCLQARDIWYPICHHISYFPQEVCAYVHWECHQLIHDPDDPIVEFILYENGDSRKYYEAKQ